MRACTVAAACARMSLPPADMHAASALKRLPCSAGYATMLPTFAAAYPAGTAHVPCLPCRRTAFVLCIGYALWPYA